MSTGVSQFLFKYCITPHSTTGLSLADRVVVGQEVVLVGGRKLCSQMDLEHPDLDRKVQETQDHQKQGRDVHAKLRDFVVEDTVYARNYGQGQLWLPGQLVEKLGAVLYYILGWQETF